MQAVRFGVPPKAIHRRVTKKEEDLYAS